MTLNTNIAVLALFVAASFHMKGYNNPAAAVQIK
jgi:hypothetical protein